MGRLEDKVKKNLLVINKTPGPEILKAEAVSGQHGLSLEELAPYGVIGAITPCTNPSESVINNGIGMISGGNAVVFNAHPAAKKTNAFTIDLMNRLLVAEGAPANLLACVSEPTIESANELMRAPGIRLVVVTGGPAVVKAAFASGKKVIAAGPGNPPVVVDETADLEQAGRGIVAGASFDNNIVCICEKEVIAVEAIADRLKAAMVAAGAYELRGPEIAVVEKLVVDGWHPNKDFVGKDASHILRAAGISFTGDPRLIFADVPFEHPFIQAELLMPVIGFTRAKDVHEAIQLALKAEHGFRHTASMYSKNIDNLHEMARAADCSIFIKNGPNFNGLGFEGPGSTSFTIASPTGEGMTNASHFTRRRRCVLKDHFRIV
jgi:acyl-CoA reductase-like NAD-dependent aldehyde dehydrogenase